MSGSNASATKNALSVSSVNEKTPEVKMYRVSGKMPLFALLLHAAAGTELTVDMSNDCDQVQGAGLSIVNKFAIQFRCEGDEAGT